METEEKQQLARARELIQQKQFDEARLILQSMPFSETAEKWLAKLNERTVQQQMMPAYESAAMPQKELKPWNISWIYNSRFILFFGLAIALPAAIIFSLNWKRLGKPEYMLESILVIVLFGMGMVASMTMMVMDIVSAPLGFAVFVGCSVAIMGFSWALGNLQAGAYKTWQIGGTQALLNHHYDFSRQFLQAGAFVLLIVGVASGAFFYGSTPKSYEDDLVKIEYSRSYAVFDANWADYCRNEPDYGCYLTLGIKAPTQYTATMFVFAAHADESAQNVVDTLPQRLQSNPNITVTATNPIVVSGRNGLIVDFTNVLADPAEPNVYQTTIMVASNTHWFELNSWTQNAEVHTDRRDDLMELVENMVIK